MVPGLYPVVDPVAEIVRVVTPLVVLVSVLYAGALNVRGPRFGSVTVTV